MTERIDPCAGYVVIQRYRGARSDHKIFSTTVKVDVPQPMVLCRATLACTIEGPP